MLEILNIAPLNWYGIAASLAAGGIIGLERQLLGKPVGMRTSMLITLGTYVFIVISNSVADSATDPSRIIGQVVTGIGFIGAGVMLTKNGSVVGVTSASAIWMEAAIGSSIGLNYFGTGIKLALLTVIVLVGVDVAEHTLKAFQRGVYKKMLQK